MALTLDARCELFWAGLDERLELPAEAKSVVIAVAKASGMFTPEIRYVQSATSVTTPTATPVAVTKSRQSGYNVFIKTENARLRPTMPETKSRMDFLIAQWNGMSPEQKLEWTAKVPGYVPTPVKPAVKLSAYQQFVKDNHGKFQAQGLESNQCMVEIGKLWQSQKEANKTPQPAKPSDAEGINYDQLIEPVA